MSKEFSSDDTAETFASQDQLRQLYGQTTSWLDNNVDIQYPPSGVIGDYEGLPMTDEPLSREVMIDGDAIRSILPVAADDLHVGDQLGIAENLPGWLQARSPERELDYSEPLCRFTVRRTQDDPIVETDLFIQEDIAENGTRIYTTTRTDETRLPREAESTGDIDPTEQLAKFLEARDTHARVGGDELTGNEYFAWQSVVDCLDDLHNWQPPENSTDDPLPE
jgi:hypothetical protein